MQTARIFVTACAFAATIASIAFADTHYVDVNNPTPSYPYTSWGTASTNIRMAVQPASAGDTVLVSNGTYYVDVLTVVSKALTIESVNGARETIVDAQGLGGCFYLATNAALLRGFTIQNGNGSAGSAVECANGSTAATVTDCILIDNKSGNGGAMMRGIASNCVFRGNRAESFGGATYDTVVYNSAFAGNLAGYGGAGRGGSFYNCTIAENRAVNQGGGLYNSTAYNSIVWDNTAGSSGNNLASTPMVYGCSRDAVHGSNGNITNNPGILSITHIATNSPCRGAGTNFYAYGLDIDGQAWQDSPSMGCDEYLGSGTVTGEVHISIAGPAALVVNSVADYFLSVEGPATWTVQDFGNGYVVTNGLFSSEQSWGATGVFDIVVSVYNDSYPGGVHVTQTVLIVEFSSAITFVADAAGSDTNNGLSGATPKKTIQAGIDANIFHGGFVVVDDGIYLLTNAITIDKSIGLASVNTPETTIIDGGGSVRCFEIFSECYIIGFDVQNGYTAESGGGFYCESDDPVIANCRIIGNRSSGGNGGGAQNGMYRNCLFVSNSANYGGAAYSALIYNSTISRNHATTSGGGTYGCGSYNTIVYFNTSDGSSADIGAGSHTYCCSPGLAGGSNISSDPMFVDITNGNFRLKKYSPCFNAGNNTYVDLGALDLDKSERIAYSTVDMGAFEYDANTADSDLDGMTDGNEDRSGTDALDNTSYFAATNIVVDGGSTIVKWEPQPGFEYSVLWSDDPMNSYSSLVVGLIYPQCSYTDSAHNAEAGSYYQLRVHLGDL